jgi:hypothetical protein
MIYLNILGIKKEREIRASMLVFADVFASYSPIHVTTFTIYSDALQSFVIASAINETVFHKQNQDSALALHQKAREG